jgi:hypothetical protein
VSVSFSYRMNDLRIEDVADVLDELWASLQVDEALRARVTAVGVDASSLPANRQSGIHVEPAAAGLGGADVVVVLLLPLAAEIARDFWKEIVLPRLKKKLGEDALSEVKG